MRLDFIMGRFTVIVILLHCANLGALAIITISNFLAHS